MKPTAWRGYGIGVAGNADMVPELVAINLCLGTVAAGRGGMPAPYPA